MYTLTLVLSTHRPRCKVLRMLGHVSVYTLMWLSSSINFVF